MLSIIANSAWNESEFLQYMQYTHSYIYKTMDFTLKEDQDVEGV